MSRAVHLKKAAAFAPAIYQPRNSAIPENKDPFRLGRKGLAEELLDEELIRICK